MTTNHTDNLELLIATLPVPLQEALRRLDSRDLIEIVMDLGRLPQARFPTETIDLADIPVRQEDLQHVVALVGEFSGDNRAGIEGTLHRVSAIRNRRGSVVGLTLRVGRAVFGTIDLIRDIVERGSSLLLLGRPGIGKTTKLREVARVLADDCSKRVVVVDTSNEIAGDGDIPHPAIGGARRMQVSHPDRQHAVMIEAVENHMPEVIIVDEIGTTQEAAAARTIAERGVQLVATAHGNTLENLVLNPTLSDLVGGVQTVTLGDEEARMRHTQKTISERKAPPTFDTVVEIVDRDEVVVHNDTAYAVDELLRGRDVGGERRRSGEAITPLKIEPAPMTTRRAPLSTPSPALPRHGPARLYPYALSPESVDKVIRDLNINAVTVRKPEAADYVVALRARAADPRLRRIIEVTHAPLHVVKKNSTAQIRRLLQNVFNVVHGVKEDELREVVREVEDAIAMVVADGKSVELTPRPPQLRKLQHRIVSRHQLVAESMGAGAARHLVIYPE